MAGGVALARWIAAHAGSFRLLLRIAVMRAGSASSANRRPRRECHADLAENYRDESSLGKCPVSDRRANPEKRASPKNSCQQGPRHRLRENTLRTVIQRIEDRSELAPAPAPYGEGTLDNEKRNRPEAIHALTIVPPSSTTDPPAPSHPQASELRQATAA